MPISEEENSDIDMNSGDERQNIDNDIGNNSDVNDSNEDPASPTGSSASETEQERRGSDRVPTMAAILFGNIDSEGKLTDNDFLDNETKEKLSGLSALLGQDSEKTLFEISDTKENDESPIPDNTDSESEPFIAGQKASDAQDFSNMDEAMTDESSSSDEDESEEEKDNCKTSNVSKTLHDVNKPEAEKTNRDEHSNHSLQAESKDDILTKKEDNLDSELMPPPPGPGLIGKTNSVSPKANDTTKIEKKSVAKAGPIIKPLASMMPERYRGVDIKTLFPEFRENKVLRFSRLFPVKQANKPNIWKNIKRRLKKIEGEQDEPTIKVSRPYTYENSFAPLPDPILHPEAYVEDQAVRFHSAKQARYQSIA